MNERRGCRGGGPFSLVPRLSTYHCVLWAQAKGTTTYHCVLWAQAKGTTVGCGGAREGVQMLWIELCPPKSTAALTPHPETVFRDEAFEEVIKVK